MRKKFRLLENLHVHVLASSESSSGRETLHLEYFTLLLKQLTEPLWLLPKDKAARKVVEFMNGHLNPLDGIPPAVKAALTKAYKEGSKAQMVRVADLVTLLGIKKAPKKRIAAMLEPSDDGLREGVGDTLAKSEEENSSNTDEFGNSSAKKTPAGRGKGGSSTAEKKSVRGLGSGGKRKR
ncbi:Replication factor C subunit 1 [Quillaja saponaria]|uniref:Replication factor C subunit 1 n=1 Tax=Quillaja saponaria TaxID=32244 RepID=A0AAD7PYT8_QUISA|nr:Replication factor C subunit 1 [Quillaja saponaria]